MIRVTRAPLPKTTLTSMVGYTGDIGQAAVPNARAKQLWNWNNTIRRHIHPVLTSTLAEMAPGLERCMYCGDNQGTDIDHFEPIRVNPLRTFDWHNHLLACSLCNSHLKRDLFPLADDGTSLLIDPSSEDPAPHLHLSLAAGAYIDLTDRGDATIKVFRPQPENPCPRAAQRLPDHPASAGQVAYCLRKGRPGGGGRLCGNHSGNSRPPTLLMPCSTRLWPQEPRTFSRTSPKPSLCCATR